MEENELEQEASKPTEAGDILLNLAVVIMGTISCYTTAVGITPMLGNKFFAFCIAVALSLFMIVIAINLPEADTKAKKRGSIFAYSIVAIFSILLNFNAIYGIANAKTLLYEELDEKRNALITLRRTAFEDIDELHKVSYWQGQVNAAREEMELEKLTPGEEGCGPKCRKIYREKVLPSEGALKSAKVKSESYHERIENKVGTIYPEPINSVLQSSDPKLLKEGIQDIVEVYQDVARDIGPVTQKDYGTLRFENKNVGDLNHAINTIFNFGSKGGEAKASIFISLLISFIIDFLILFVILFLAPPVEKQEVEFADFPGRRRRQQGASKKPLWSVSDYTNNSKGKKRKNSRSSGGRFADRPNNNK